MLLSGSAHAFKIPTVGLRQECKCPTQEVNYSVMLLLFLANPCVFPENIHTSPPPPPTQKVFASPQPPRKFQFSFTLFFSDELLFSDKSLAFNTPPPPGISNDIPCRKYGYFLDRGRSSFYPQSHARRAAMCITMQINGKNEEGLGRGRKGKFFFRSGLRPRSSRSARSHAITPFSDCARSTIPPPQKRKDCEQSRYFLDLPSSMFTIYV